jgi:hypothetical protein
MDSTIAGSMNINTDSGVDPGGGGGRIGKRYDFLA